MSTNFKFCKRCNCETVRTNDGRCKPCFTAYMKVWAVENKEKKLACVRDWMARNAEKIKAWRQSNVEKIKGYDKAWNLANPERRKEIAKASREKRKEKAAVQSAKYRRENPTQVRALAASRRARKKKADGKYTPQDIARIMEMQKNKCAVCKTCIKDSNHIDHVMPLALGGTNWPDNLQVLCPPCNLSKNKKHPVDFMQQKGYLL